MPKSGNSFVTIGNERSAITPIDEKLETFCLILQRIGSELRKLQAFGLSKVYLHS